MSQLTRAPSEFDGKQQQVDRPVLHQSCEHARSGEQCLQTQRELLPRFMTFSLDDTQNDPIFLVLFFSFQRLLFLIKAFSPYLFKDFGGSECMQITLSVYNFG